MMDEQKSTQIFGSFLILITAVVTVLGFLVLFGSLVYWGLFSNVAIAQTFPPLDDNQPIARNEAVVSGVTTTTLIGISTVSGEVWTVVLDNSNSIIESRLATADEIVIRDEFITIDNFTTSHNALILDVTETWVNNRTTELQQCENDATAGLALGNWTLLSNGQQNAVITSLLTCQEVNSRVNRKTIISLLDILVAEGIIQ